MIFYSLLLPLPIHSHQKLSIILMIFIFRMSILPTLIQEFMLSRIFHYQLKKDKKLHLPRKYRNLNRFEHNTKTKYFLFYIFLYFSPILIGLFCYSLHNFVFQACGVHRSVFVASHPYSSTVNAANTFSKK